MSTPSTDAYQRFLTSAPCFWARHLAEIKSPIDPRLPSPLSMVLAAGKAVPFHVLQELFNLPNIDLIFPAFERQTARSPDPLVQNLINGLNPLDLSKAIANDDLALWLRVTEAFPKLRSHIPELLASSAANIVASLPSSKFNITRHLPAVKDPQVLEALLQHYQPRRDFYLRKKMMMLAEKPHLAPRLVERYWSLLEPLVQPGQLVNFTGLKINQATRNKIQALFDRHGFDAVLLRRDYLVTVATAKTAAALMRQALRADVVDKPQMRRMIAFLMNQPARQEAVMACATGIWPGQRAAVSKDAFTAICHSFNIRDNETMTVAMRRWPLFFMPLCLCVKSYRLWLLPAKVLDAAVMDQVAVAVPACITYLLRGYGPSELAPQRPARLFGFKSDMDVYDDLILKNRHRVMAGTPAPFASKRIATLTRAKNLKGGRFVREPLMVVPPAMERVYHNVVTTGEFRLAQHGEFVPRHSVLLQSPLQRTEKDLDQVRKNYAAQLAQQRAITRYLPADLVKFVNEF